MNNIETKEQIVVKAGNGNIIMQRDTIEDAVEWAKKQRETHGDRAPSMKVVRVIITKEEEEIAHV